MPLQTQLVCTFLSTACANRQHCAGPGCPLPYRAPSVLARPIPRSETGESYAEKERNLPHRRLRLHERGPRRLPGGRLRRLRAERRAGRGIRPAHHARRQARGLWPHRAYPHGLARPLHPALSGCQALRRLRFLAPALSGGVPHQGAARDGRPEPHRRAEPAARRPDARADVRGLPQQGPVPRRHGEDRHRGGFF